MITREKKKKEEESNLYQKILSTLPKTTNSRKLSGDEFNIFAYSDTERNSQTE